MHSIDSGASLQPGKPISRVPQAVSTFALPDFFLFAIRPLSIRFIAGFAQALTLTPTAFANALTP